MKDPDPSILRRAVDLCFALINEQNVKGKYNLRKIINAQKHTFIYLRLKQKFLGTMREILIFLESCPTEFKSDVASNIVSIAAKYAPNAQWHIDTILKVNIHFILRHCYVIF